MTTFFRKEYIYLRPRHIMCLLGYHDTWYNTESENNIVHLQMRLRKNPHLNLRLSDGECDDICFKCPHYRMNTCMKYVGANHDFKSKDNYILTRLPIPTNELTYYKFQYLAHIVLVTLKRKSQVQYTCESCPFIHKCKFYKQLQS